MQDHTRFSSAAWIAGLAALGVCASGAVAALEIRGAVLAAGGGGATSPRHQVHGTLGQALAGGASSGSYSTEGGFWTGGGVPTDVTENPAPARFLLRDVWPNPFAERLTIRYEVPAGDGPMELGIYDVGGRLVRPLVSRSSAAGRRVVSWDGTDAAGREVGSGIYFCRMEAPGYRRALKVVVAR